MKSRPCAKARAHRAGDWTKDNEMSLEMRIISVLEELATLGLRLLRGTCHVFATFLLMSNGSEKVLKPASLANLI